MDAFNLPPFQPAKRDTSSDDAKEEETKQHDMPWFTTSASGSTDALFGGSYQPQYNTQPQTTQQPQYNEPQQQQHFTSEYSYSYGHYSTNAPNTNTNTANQTNPPMMKSTSIPSIQSTLPPWEDNVGAKMAVSGEEPEAVMRAQPVRSGSTSRHSSVSSTGSVGAGPAYPQYTQQVQPPIQSYPQPSYTQPVQPVNSPTVSQHSITPSYQSHHSHQHSHQHSPQDQTTKQPLVSPRQEKFCTRCGTKNAAESNFCCRCGLQLTQSPTFPDFEVGSMTSELQSMKVESRSPEPAMTDSALSYGASSYVEPALDTPSYRTNSVYSAQIYPQQNICTVQSQNSDHQYQYQQQQHYQPPQQPEPVKPSRVHPVVSFGFGGRLVYTIPQRQTRYSAATNSTVDCVKPGFLNVCSVESKCSDLKIFESALPQGPFDEKTKPKEIAKALLAGTWSDEKMTFLCHLIGNALDNNGQIMCTANCQFIKDQFKSNLTFSNEPIQPQDSTLAMTLMCNGDLNSGMNELIKACRFDEAFAVAGVLGKSAECVRAFVEHLPDGHLMPLLFAFLGLIDDSVVIEKIKSIPWQSIVYVYSSYHKQPSAIKTLQQLSLSVQDDMVSSIYTVLSVSKQSISDGLSELYEYCLRLSGQPAIADLLPFKLEAASKCIDLGDFERAQRYLAQLAGTDGLIGRRRELLEDRLEHSAVSLPSQKGKTKPTSTMWSKFNLADAIVSSVIGADHDEERPTRAADKKPLFTPEKSPVSSLAPPVSPSPQPQYQQQYQSFYSAYGSESSEASAVSGIVANAGTVPLVANAGTVPHSRTTLYGQQHPIEPNYGQPTVSPVSSASYEQPSYSQPAGTNDQQYYNSYGYQQQPQHQPGPVLHQQPVQQQPTYNSPPQDELQEQPASPAPKQKQQPTGGVLSILKSFITSSSASPPSAAAAASTIGSADAKNSPTRANLGEQSKFRYDDRLKRWVEEGSSVDEQPQSVPTFPPAVMPSISSGTNAPDYRGIKKHFDPFNISHALGQPQQHHQQPQPQPQYEETTLF